MKHMGNDLVIQMGGGIHGHPNGTGAGARAARQAINATLEGVSLKKYAENHPELREALKMWGG
jgi:ribulose-bisphosphate carboxylase large chain